LKIRAGWQRGNVAAASATDLLAALRTATFAAAADKVVEMLNKNVDPSCVWDGLFLTAGELLMRNPNIVGLHAVTTANALHFAYQTSGSDETRRMMMLQAASFLTMFRNRIGNKAENDVRADAIQPVAMKGPAPEAVAEIFASLPKDRVTAARK